jgi:pimeloyl-ACP methyl ester carboxylesterase
MFELVQGHRIEYELIDNGSARTVVFLHEGLGSIAMWKDFPQRCAAAAQCNALIYSRYGYGQSDPITEPRNPRYMHDEALLSLPEFLAKLKIAQPILFGHSDGASIALIYASAHPVEAVIVLAPHLFVENISIESIRAARTNYENGLRERLARYHANPDSAFRGWNDIWLHPDFRNWNVEAEVSRIQAPILAIQGYDDEYGTMLQLDRIGKLLPRPELLKLDRCRHSPHRDQPEAVIAAVVDFLQRY